MSSLKLLWLPGEAHYRARLFAGPNTQARAFAGELTLQPAEAATLHRLLDFGSLAAAFGGRGDELEQTGWIDPPPRPREA